MVVDHSLVSFELFCFASTLMSLPHYFIQLSHPLPREVFESHLNQPMYQITQKHKEITFFFSNSTVFAFNKETVTK